MQLFFSDYFLTGMLFFLFGFSLYMLVYENSDVKKIVYLARMLGCFFIFLGVAFVAGAQFTNNISLGKTYIYRCLILATMLFLFYLVLNHKKFTLEKFLKNKKFAKSHTIVRKLQKDYLNSLNAIAVDLVKKTMNTKNVLIIMKKTKNTLIFPSGIFADEHISDEWLQKLTLGTNIHTFKSEHCISSSFSPCIDELGWVVVAGNQFQSQTSTDSLVLENVTRKIINFIHVMDRIGSINQLNERLPEDNFKASSTILTSEAVTSEQRKFASYLHDEVLQSVLALRNFAVLLDGDEETKQLMHWGFENLHNSIREKMTDVYPAGLTTESFYENIVLMLDKLKNQSNDSKKAKFTLKYDENLEIGKEFCFPLYRIIKELNQNAIKHARASEIITKIFKEKNSIRVQVIDNGCGFEVNKLNKGTLYGHHIGLLTVQQDVSSMGGKFFIKSCSKENIGVFVDISVPLVGGISNEDTVSR